jgi:hypothetical protein
MKVILKSGRQFEVTKEEAYQLKCSIADGSSKCEAFCDKEDSVKGFYLLIVLSEIAAIR